MSRRVNISGRPALTPEEAEEKARKLFRSLLTRKQLEELRTKGWLTVKGGVTNQPYIIHPGYSANIRVKGLPSCTCKACTQDSLRTLCCHMRIIAPVWDHMVAQLLHIKYNEEEFLEKAYIS